MSRFTRVLLLLFSLSLGECAWAADAENLTRHINGWNGGGSGSLAAKVTNTNEITVTGSVTNAKRGFSITNTTAPITIRWNADLSGYSNHMFDSFDAIRQEVYSYRDYSEMSSLIALGDDPNAGGTFIINGKISSMYDDMTINMLGFDIIVGSKGVVTNEVRTAIDGDRMSNVTVEPGGRVSAPRSLAVSVETPSAFTGDTSGIVGLVVESGEVNDIVKVNAASYGVCSYDFYHFKQAEMEGIDRFSGSLTVTSGSVLTVTDHYAFDQDFNLTIQRGGALTLLNGKTLDNQGIITIDAGGLLVNHGDINNYTFNSFFNSGTINNFPTGAINNYGHFDNTSGVVNNEGIMTGTESIGGTVTNEIPDKNGEEDPSVVNPPSNSSGGGGCNAGFVGILATLALAAPLASRKK